MSAKNMDDHNRWRNVTVAFRMSPEEAEKLNAFVRLSGLSKQDYLIRRVLQQEGDGHRLFQGLQGAPGADGKCDGGTEKNN